MAAPARKWADARVKFEAEVVREVVMITTAMREMDDKDLVVCAAKTNARKAAVVRGGVDRAAETTEAEAAEKPAADLEVAMAEAALEGGRRGVAPVVEVLKVDRKVEVAEAEGVAAAG